MAKFGSTFDATGVEPAKTFEVLPPGTYLAQIVNSEMRVTRDGRGQYLFVENDILEGPCKGRKAPDRLNLINDNPQTVDIAQRTLSAICHATGCLQVQDSEELHLIPFTLVVQVQPPKNGYGETNRFRYQPLDRAPQVVSPQPAPPQPAAPAVSQLHPAASGFTSAPWKRSA